MTKIQPYAEYKDTGVDWLGQLPTHWDVVPSKWLFSLRAERAAPGAVHLMASQKYGVISQAKFMAEKDQRVVQTIVGGENMKRICVNDFLIHLRSFQGGIEWSANEGKVSPAYTVLSPNKGVHPPFFYYLLKSDGYIQELRATTNQLRDGQSMNYSQFATVPLIEVPWDEQVAIANFLDRETAQIDNLLGKQERLIEIVAERRASLLNSIVSEAGTGWPNQPLKRMAQITVGIVVTPAAWYSDEGVLALRGVNIRPESITLDDVVRLTREGHAFHSKSELRTGDVVVVRTGQAGTAAVVPENLSGANAIDLLIIRPDPGIDGEYLAMIVNTSTVQEQVRQHSVGAIQAHFNVGSLREVAVSIPPFAIQREAIKTWREKSADLDVLHAKSTQLVARLRERRSALISAAVTGKIDVTNEGVAA